MAGKAEVQTTVGDSGARGWVEIVLGLQLYPHGNGSTGGLKQE